MIDPIGAASFPCGEIPEHRKKAQKNTPKKANHKHEYESVILSYITSHFKLTPGGFVPGRTYAAGKRCTVCGRLDTGFPDGKCPEVYHRIKMEKPSGDVIHHIIRHEYLHLPVIKVKSLFDLKEENIYG